MKKATQFVFIALLSLLFFLWTEIAKSPAGDAARVFFFDVGQGDSSMIEKGNYQILIDGGPDEKVLSEIGKAMPISDKNIEVVVLTHPHADHLTGLNKVLERYDVGTIYSTGVAHTSDTYLDFLQKIKDKKIDLRVPAIYEKFIPFDDASLEFLWPGDQYVEKETDNLNNSSEIVRFCYYEQCVFFPGDAEINEQNSMFDYYANIPDSGIELHARILKAAHHGSSNGSSERTFQAIGPAYTVISSGQENKYGHPHQSTLELAQRFDASIIRTDQAGTSQFVLHKDGVVLAK